MLVICCSQLLVLVDCNKLHLRVGYCAISSDNRQYVVCENILTLTLAGGQPEWFYPEAEEALCDVGFAFECSQWGGYCPPATGLHRVSAFYCRRDPP